MIFKVVFDLVDSHAHCRLFSSPSFEKTWAKLGEFRVHRGEEFSAIRRSMSGVPFERGGEEEKEVSGSVSSRLK